MRRRAFLGAVGMAALAGCSNGTDSSTPTPTPTATTTSTGSGTPEFEFLGVSMPDTVQLNMPTAFELAVRNVGSAEGTFTSPLEDRMGDGEWRRIGEIDMTLAAGETGRWQSPRFTPRYLTTLHYRLTAVDETWSMKVVPKQLDFGNYYATPTGLYLNALGGTFETEYPTPDERTATNGTATAEPTRTPTAPDDDGNVWLVMRLDVRNRLEESQSTPAAEEFVLEVDGERRSLHQEVAEDPYEGGPLAGQTARRGELIYAVPEGTQARDLTLSWGHSYEGGDVRAVWTK